MDKSTDTNTFLLPSENSPALGNKMSNKKLKPLSGFPEWLPKVREIELAWLSRIQQVYSSYGYSPIETASVELITTLAAKGIIDKEIYLLKKPHTGSKDEYGLHYDLTVPFARYVAQNKGYLTFPFKRYQIQKVWRGERPQRGRFREFYQFDIDVVGLDSLNPYYELEVLLAGYEALSSLEIPPFIIEINNRKIYEGYLESLGLTDSQPILRIIDKLDKIGEEGVSKLLESQLFFPLDLIQKILRPSRIKSADLSFVEQFKELNISSRKAEEGLRELEQIMRLINEMGKESIQVNLGFVRGFDYYTGIIFEGKFLDDPFYGSICSGGRYENLVGSFIDTRMPGVGFSIGFTRIFSKLLEEEKLPSLSQNSVDVFIVRTEEGDLIRVCKLAEILRRKGLKVEISGDLTKIPKQLKYASRKKIPWVWIASKNDPHSFEVKNMLTGEQQEVDPHTWLVPGKNLSP